MIKINLKNTKTSYSVYSKTGVYESDKSEFQTAMTSIMSEWFSMDFSWLSPFIVLLIIVKLALIGGFPLSLYVYESQIITSLEDSLKVVEQKQASQKKRLDDLKVKIENEGDLESKSKEYDQKKKFLKTLASSRLIIPKLLDQIQTVIPDSVWLKKIEVKIDDQGSLKVVGESLGEDRINLFADSLKSIVKRDSIKVDMNDIKKNNNFVKVSFVLTAVLLTRRVF